MIWTVTSNLDNFVILCEDLLIRNPSWTFPLHKLTVREPVQLQTAVRRYVGQKCNDADIQFYFRSTESYLFFISTPLSLDQTSQGNFCLRPLSTNVSLPEVYQHGKLIFPVCYLLHHDNCYCHYTVVELIILLTEMQCFKFRSFQFPKKVFWKNWFLLHFSSSLVGQVSEMANEDSWFLCGNKLH